MLFCIYERLRLLCFYACNGLLGAVASCCKAAKQVRPNNKSIFSTQIKLNGFTDTFVLCDSCIQYKSTRDSFVALAKLF